MNTVPKMVYDYLDKDPLVPTSQWLQLADFTVVQPYGIAHWCLPLNGHGYGSSSANLHHPREAIPKVSQSNH
jgi:hypothetical protein